MFSKQRQFVPKTLPKPKVKVRSVPVESPASSKPRTPLTGSSSRATSSSLGTSTSASRRTPSRPSPAAGLKRGSDGRPRASNSPFASSSADERGGGGYLAPPSLSRHSKRIRSPTTTDSETRVAFEESDDDDDDEDNDWEYRLKRRRKMQRTDPNRRLRNVALTDLAETGYGDKGGKPLQFVHAADLVSLALGDSKVFPDAKPEELVVELQYPGSLSRERYVCAPTPGSSRAILIFLDTGSSLQRRRTNSTLLRTSPALLRMSRRRT